MADVWFLRFIQDDEEDEWAIYPTRDGDTLWNSNENKDCTPSYLQDVFENLRNSILARDETLERANRKSKLKKCSTDQPESSKRMKVMDLSGIVFN